MPKKSNREIRQAALRDNLGRKTFTAVRDSVYDSLHSAKEHWTKIAPGFYMRERIIHD